ncbi:MAG: hypothetical protein JO257_18330 [Deltaproteobacteria bacterium]|nr:hypothetical protein [Deltaproteobacteria bacterium]
MARPQVVLDLAGKHELARDLAAGGVFVPGAAVSLNEECELVMRGPANDELRVAAVVVFVNAAGAGLQLLGCDAEMKQRIAALANPTAPPADAEEHAGPAVTEEHAGPAVAEEPDEPAAPAEPAAEQSAAAGDAAEQAAAATAAADAADDAEAASIPKNVHERLRGLTLVQQLKYAREGELAERILLERIYGKAVWEALLRNPRLTSPEVARIARMGSLPRPMIELIVANGGWLQIPEVRRALLSNPRLGPDQIQRVLRLMPKHELKLAAIQTAYPFAVRNVARSMLKDQ